MTTEELLKSWINTPRLFSLADRLSMSAPQNIYVKNLQGSSSQFVAAAAFLHPSCNGLNHVFVCNDAEDAAYFHNTLENLTGALNLFYFPSSFKNRKNYRLLNSSHVMLRTEALTRFSMPTGQRVGAMVTYPEALFEKVVVPKAIAENIIHLKTNDVLDTNNLFERLVHFGFERTDFVYEPGQFAVRGGIIDIYSFGNEKPYRIELFGNDVDSIRIIDPETQLSERRLLQVSIIPNVDRQFEDEDKVSLFEFLPQNTVVWMQDADLVRERLEIEEENLGFYIALQQELAEMPKTKKNAEPEEDNYLVKPSVGIADFTTAADFTLEVAQRHQVHFDRLPATVSNPFEIEFHTRQQPSFNRQFDLLIKDLKSWESKGFELQLFAENAKQLERLYTIFTDLKAEITFNPVLLPFTKALLMKI